jgi:hypothetical protein
LKSRRTPDLLEDGSAGSSLLEPSHSWEILPPWSSSLRRATLLGEKDSEENFSEETAAPRRDLSGVRSLTRSGEGKAIWQSCTKAVTTKHKFIRLYIPQMTPTKYNRKCREYGKVEMY